MRQAPSWEWTLGLVSPTKPCPIAALERVVKTLAPLPTPPGHTVTKVAMDEIFNVMTEGHTGLMVLTLAKGPSALPDVSTCGVMRREMSKGPNLGALIGTAPTPRVGIGT